MNAPLRTLPAFVATVTPASVFEPVKALFPLRSATLLESRASASVPEDTFAALRFVRPEPLPLTLSTVTAPAEKLPEASRFTMAFAVLALVAALAVTVPAATLAEDWPPTLETTVAPWVPVTSPDSGSEKPPAVVAVAALPVTLPVTFPVRFPMNAPLRTLPVFVATVTPASVFEPVKALFPLRSATLPESRASASDPTMFVAATPPALAA